MVRHALSVMALAAAGASTVGTAAAAVPAPIVFDFSTSAEGWTVLYDGALTHIASGGFLRLNDTDTATDFELRSPVGLVGDLSGFVGGTLRFDARNPLGVVPDWPDFGRITLSGAGRTLSIDGVALTDQPPADGAWHTYTVRLSAADADFGPDLPLVLGQLTALSIKTEFHQGLEDVIDIDNIQLSPVPEAPRWALLLAGMLTVPLLYRRRC